MTNRIRSQNQRLKKYLDSGKSIHCFSPVRQRLEIGYLNSRCSDLKKEGYPLGKQRITVKDVHGRPVNVVRYFKDMSQAA